MLQWPTFGLPPLLNISLPFAALSFAIVQFTTRGLFPRLYIAPPLLLAVFPLKVQLATVDAAAPML